MKNIRRFYLSLVQTHYHIHFAVLILLLLFDGPLYRGFHSFIDWESQKSIIGLHELFSLRNLDFFEQFGSVWAGIMSVWIVSIHAPDKRRYIWGFIISAFLSNGIREVLRHSVGKLRPSATEGVVTYLHFPSGWHQFQDLSFPSGHTLFAFNLATFLAILYPKTRRLFFSLAIGCGLSRIVNHAHYFSDVYSAALLGYAMTAGTLYLLYDLASEAPRSTMGVLQTKSTGK